jgi:allophanate hydrolase subunit 2
VDVEVLTVFLLNKGMPTVRAKEHNRLGIGLILDEPQGADFAYKLAAASGIVVEVYMGSTATWTYGISRNRILAAGFYRFKLLAVL